MLKVTTAKEAEMLTAILILVGVLSFGATVVLIVFAIGMRRKTPWVLNSVRRFARAVGNPYQMRKAGTPGAYASVIRHEGRRSGRSYATPVAAVPKDDGFVIAMVYGPNTDWLKNVLARGSATIEHEGRVYPVDRPEIVPMEDVEEVFGPKELRTLRRYRVTQCLRVRRIEPLREEPAEDLESVLLRARERRRRIGRRRRDVAVQGLQRPDRATPNRACGEVSRRTRPRSQGPRRPDASGRR